MNKMVHKLRLKQTIVKRFVNIDSDEEEGCDPSDDEDIQVIGTEDHSNKSCDNVSIGADMLANKNNRFANFKVFVSGFGEKIERFVDIECIGDPFVGSEDLNRLINCEDLNQIESVLRRKDNRSKPSQENKKQKNKNKNKKSKKKKKNKKNESSLETQSETLDETHCEIQTRTQVSESDDYCDKLLSSEGIKRKNKNSDTNEFFKCLICEISLIGRQLAVEHSLSDEHLKRKLGDDLKGLDALFTIDSERIGDVQIAIHRKKQLSKMDNNDKQNYLNHGIRLKDGVGENAFICLKCKMSFESIKGIQNHMILINSVMNTAVEESFETSVSPKRMSDEDIKLKNEGIESRKSNENKSQFYCLFCNTYIDFKRTAVSHISDPRHRTRRRGENLTEIDSNFTVKSDRIDELEVALARKTTLKTIPPNQKLELTAQRIQLKDGIGSESFVCSKCDLPIGSFDAIDGHIKSLGHSM